MRQKGKKIHKQTTKSRCGIASQRGYEVINRSFAKPFYPENAKKKKKITINENKQSQF
jgi:hypothetical protein